jgi:hypothetical protein
MRVFEVGRHIHLLNSDELGVKHEFSAKKVSQFSLEQFVDAFETMLSHERVKKGWWRGEGVAPQFGESHCARAD